MGGCSLPAYASQGELPQSQESSQEVPASLRGGRAMGSQTPPPRAQVYSF